MRACMYIKQFFVYLRFFEFGDLVHRFTNFGIQKGIRLLVIDIRKITFWIDDAEFLINRGFRSCENSITYKRSLSMACLVNGKNTGSMTRGRIQSRVSSSFSTTDSIPCSKSSLFGLNFMPWTTIAICWNKDKLSIGQGRTRICKLNERLSSDITRFSSTSSALVQRQAWSDWTSCIPTIAGMY